MPQPVAGCHGGLPKDTPGFAALAAKRVGGSWALAADRMEQTLTQGNRKNREMELRSMLKDPVGRIVLERRFFEATKRIPPQSDDHLLEAILDHEYGTEAGVT